MPQENSQQTSQSTRTSARIVHFVAWFCVCLLPAAQANDVTIPSLDGKLQIPGFWFTAGATAVASDKRPAIIALHGCDGARNSAGKVSAGYVREATYFNAEGMHFLVIDSFTARGQKGICDIPNADRTIFEEDRREDVFAAIRWLAAQADVDAARIAILGWSHGAQTVLSVLDRTDKYVQAQPIQPRAAIAYYAGCKRFAEMWNYEISAPLLLMSGELDDWTPARDCARLNERVVSGQKDAVINFRIFPGSYHAFNGTTPVRTVYNAANTKTGSATAGGNPAAREASYRLMFEFLSAQFAQPLRLTNEQRLALTAHRYVIPPDSGFARFDNSAAVPVKSEGRARYEHYLDLPPPKAFVITEKNGWFFGANSTDAIGMAFASCAKFKLKCWLYAVDDKVVWAPEPEKRITLEKLQVR